MLFADILRNTETQLQTLSLSVTGRCPHVFSELIPAV